LEREKVRRIEGGRNPAQEERATRGGVVGPLSSLESTAVGRKGQKKSKVMKRAREEIKTQVVSH